jgi:16S rRNA processing protein RimM
VLLEVGRIAKPHGLRGEVVVELVTNRTERLAPGSVLRAGQGGHRSLEVVRSAPHQGRWIVAFAGLADRSAAEELRGTVLLAPPIQDPSALWVHDLIGSQVVDAHGVGRGRVVSVVANPASDLLELEDGSLVPARFVVSAGPGTVTVDAPEGLWQP